MSNGLLSVVISAPSGAGKSTIIDRVLEINDKACFSVSTTSRKPRSGEIEGKNYYFVSEDEFRELARKGEFVEWALVHGNYYGTSQKEIDRIKAHGNIPLFDIDVQGTRILRDRGFPGIYVFIIPPSIKDLEGRLRKRDTESDDQISLRLKNAEQEIREYINYDYIIINDVLDEAVDTLNSIIKAELSRKVIVENYIKKMWSC